MDQDDVELRGVEAEQRHVRAQADRHAQCRHLDLNVEIELKWFTRKQRNDIQ
jgi:hypothetical protein